MTSENDILTDGTEELKYWQECEMPECTNEVPTAKAICDDH